MTNRERNFVYSKMERIREEIAENPDYFEDCSIYDRIWYIVKLLLIAMGDEAEKCVFDSPKIVRDPREYMKAIDDCRDFVCNSKPWDSENALDALLLEMLDGLASELRVKLYYNDWRVRWDSGETKETDDEIHEAHRPSSSVQGEV